MLSARAILILLLSFAVQTLILVPAYSNSIEYVIDSYVKEMGGLPALQRIQTVRLTCEYTDESPAPKRLVVIKKRPNKVRMVFESSGAKIIQAFNGETVWSELKRIEGSATIQMDEKDQLNFKKSAPLESVLVNPDYSGAELSLLEDATVNNFTFYQVKALFPDNSFSIHYIDKTNFTERRIFEFGSDGQLDSTLIPGNFEIFDGIVYATQIIRKVDNKTVSSLNIIEVEHNIGVLDRTFDPPPSVDH